MPGIDRSRVVGKDQEVLDELICSICGDIFVEPVVTQCCRQSFCSLCINQWLVDNNTCPNDRQSLTVNQLLPSSRIVTNLLSKLKVKCENYGTHCESVLTIEEMANHMKTCNTCDSCKTLNKSLEGKKNELALVKNKLENCERDLIELGYQLKITRDMSAKNETEIKSLNNLVKEKVDQIKDLEQQLEYSKSVHDKLLSQTQKEKELFKNKFDASNNELDQLKQKLSESTEAYLGKSCTQRSEVEAMNFAKRTSMPTKDYEHNLQEDEVIYLIELAKRALIKENSFSTVAKFIHENVKSREDFKPYNWVIEAHFKDDLHITYTSWHKGLYVTFNGVTIRFSAFQINLAEKDEIESARLKFDQFKLVGREKVDTKLFECFINECSVALKCRDTFNGLARQLTDKLNETTNTNWVVMAYNSNTSYCLKSFKKILVDINRLKIRVYEVNLK